MNKYTAVVAKASKERHHDKEGSQNVKAHKTFFSHHRPRKEPGKPLTPLVVVVVEFFFLEFVRPVSLQKLSGTEMLFIVLVLKVVLVQVVVDVGFVRPNGPLFDDDFARDGFGLDQLGSFRIRHVCKNKGKISTSKTKKWSSELCSSFNRIQVSIIDRY